MDRKIILLCAGAIPLGLAGGYAWSAMTVPAAHAKHPPKARFAPLPASPEERPLEPDQDGLRALTPPWFAPRRPHRLPLRRTGPSIIRAATKSAPRAGPRSTRINPVTASRWTATATASPASPIARADPLCSPAKAGAQMRTALQRLGRTRLLPSPAHPAPGSPHPVVSRSCNPALRRLVGWAQGLNHSGSYSCLTH